MSAQLARWLHPGAWWLWALGLAACASRLTNPLMLALVIAVLAFVVSARRPDAPWGRSFAFFVRLAVLVVEIRELAQVVFGAAIGTTVLLPLPGITLPTWMAGVRLGGDVLLESLLVAFVDGLRLATILLCVGAANSLASPSRLLKSVPSALYEIGVSVVVAMSFTPQLVGDVQRVRQARRLRGRRTTGVRAIAGAAMPVLEGALERSVALAAAMDSRGYGRRGEQGPAARRAASTLLLAGLACACIGTYALLSAGIPAPVGGALVVGGAIACAASLALAGRTRSRTSYRPDPWRGPEWAVAGSGLLAGIAAVIASWLGVPGLAMPVDPPAWPLLPWAIALPVLLAASPALTAPPVPRASTVRERALEEVPA